MPYAANNQISKSEIAGGIKITDARYREALDGMMRGLIVQVSGGVMSLVEPPTEGTIYWLPPAEQHQTKPGEEPPTEAVLTSPPDKYHIIDGGKWVKNPDGWARHIADAREQALDSAIPVTLSDGDYVIPVSDRSAALAPTAARRARKEATTRPFPTDKGIIERSADDLERIEAALDTYLTAVWRRTAELEKLVAEGTIMQSDIDSGWTK